MKNEITHIVVHCTNTPSDISLSLSEIEELNSQERNTDPMPYHYIVQPDGKIYKGKRDNELCGHIGKLSRNTLSVAYVGGFDPVSGEFRNTLSPTQEKNLITVLSHLRLRHLKATITGANALLHPDEDPTLNEPYFDIPAWWAEQKTPIH